MQTSAAAQSDISKIPELKKTRGWILYDGRCPFCRRGARRLGGIVSRRGFRLVPLQRRWVQERLARTNKPVADEMLLLLPDDTLLGGVDAYIHLCRRVWWAAPIGLLASLPGCYFSLRKLYAWVAANRFGISRACGLDGCRISRAGR